MTTDWQELLANYPVREIITAEGRFSYRQAGRGPDLVLLHGIGSASGSWPHQIGAFSNRFRVTAWDAPGYGTSDCLANKTPLAEDYADALTGFLDALSIERATVVGHSLGALMAAAFAARHPDRVQALVLAAPALGYGKAVKVVRQAKLDSRLKMMAELGPGGLARERAGNLLSSSASAEQMAQVQWNMAQLRVDGHAAAAHMLAFGDLATDAALIRQRFQVICGSGDTITAAAASRAFAEAFPQASYAEIPVAGHALYIEEPDAFNALLAEALGVAA